MPGLFLLLDDEFFGGRGAVGEYDSDQVKAFGPTGGGEVFCRVGEGLLLDDRAVAVIDTDCFQAGSRDGEGEGAIDDGIGIDLYGGGSVTCVEATDRREDRLAGELVCLDTVIDAGCGYVAVRVGVGGLGGVSRYGGDVGEVGAIGRTLYYEGREVAWDACDPIEEGIWCLTFCCE